MFNVLAGPDFDTFYSDTEAKLFSLEVRLGEAEVELNAARLQYEEVQAQAAKSALRLASVEAELVALEARYQALDIRYHRLMMPAFTIDTHWEDSLLSDSQRIWYERLRNVLRLPENDLAKVMYRFSADELATTFKHHVIAIALAAHAVGGDERLFSELLALQMPLRERLARLGREAFQHPGVVSLVATLARIFYLNREHNQVYAETAKYWTDRFQVFLSSQPPGTVPLGDTADLFAAGLETLLIAWKITDDPRYKQAFDQGRSQFVADTTARNGVLVWDGRLPANSGKSLLGLQTSNRVRYTIASLVMLHWYGYPVISPDLLVPTVLQIIRERGAAAANLGGEGTYANPELQGESLFGCVIPFDTTGEVARRNAAYYLNQPTKNIHIPSQQLFAGLIKR